MSEIAIQEQLREINKKLDIVLDEVFSQRSKRKSLIDLQEDLMRVTDSAIDTVTVQLEEISEYSSIENVIYFAKKMFRNMENLSKMFDRLESIIDFWNASEPLTREIAINVQYKLDELDKKGYFEFLGELKSLMDELLSVISKEDIKALNNNIMALMEAIRETKIDPEEKISLFGLIKELNAPEVKKNISFLIKLIKNFESRKKALTI